MTRIKIASKALRTFLAHALPLSDDVRRNLRELLGNDRADLSSVESALGLGVYGGKHIDNPPRPVDYVAAFKPIHRAAVELYKGLTGLTDYYDEELTSRGVDADNAEAMVVKLIDTSRAVIEKFEKLPSGGRPKRGAVKEVTKRLKRCFRDNYRGATNARKVRGAVSPLSEWEQRQSQFVRAALRFAKLIPATYSAKDLDRLIRDPDYSLPEERNAVMDRLAHRAGKSTVPYAWPEPDEARLQRAIAATARRPKKGAR